MGRFWFCRNQFIEGRNTKREGILTREIQDAVATELLLFVVLEDDLVMMF